MDQSHNHNVELKNPINKRINTRHFHGEKVQKQAKFNYSDKSQDSGYIWSKGKEINGKGRR
jgi:hypothetical protein